MSIRGKKTQAAVLAALRAHKGALSAYDLLAELRRTQPTISAPTIYRALAALGEMGAVHRLDSVNAFIAAKGAGEGHAILSICDDCGMVEESAAPRLLAELSTVAEQSGFATLRKVIEIHGVCASCDEGSVRA